MSLATPGTAHSGRWSKFHVRMDLYCKYIVSGATALVAFTQTPTDGESLVVPYVVGMSVVSAMLGKMLKRVLQHERPGTARKDDHGMPSSHSLALAYLSWAAMLGCCVCAAMHDDGERMLDRWTMLLPGALCIGLGVYGSALRVWLGDHTFAQVAVGYVIGCGSCVAVFCVNYWGFDGPERGGRVDSYTTRYQRWVVTRVAAALCSLVFCLLWRSWRRKDAKMVAKCA